MIGLGDSLRESVNFIFNDIFKENDSYRVISNEIRFHNIVEARLVNVRLYYNNR